MFTYDGVTLPYRAERVITDPLATTSGAVFFTTYKPYADECALGGKSFLWALRYNTGDAPSYAVMKGKGLVQVSTASVEQIDLSKAFKAEFGGGMGGRRTGAIEGVPPTAQGLSLLSQPPPVKRIMHMMER
jgi:type IV pilus assembly protein PilY1